MVRILPFIALLISLSTLGQEKQVVEKRVYTTKAIGTEQPPVIDGILTDEVWNIVDWTGDYIENEPEENTQPSEQTKFKIIYDKNYLYFAFRCYDKDPANIVKRLTRRDGFDGDWVEVNIDSYNDKRTGFSFTISVSGVKGDEFISENGNSWDGSWNPIWYLKTNIDSEGWTAEVKIPFSQLKFGHSQEQVWGLQSTRRYFRAEERSVWQRVPRDAPGWVSEFGELRGLIDLQPQKQLEIQPFAVTKLATYPKEEGNPFRDGKDLNFDGGLDAKIGITNDLTLDLTINPDFGQVEADPAAIALDGFQIFFEERRPFFIENKNIFNYRFGDGQDNLFYSRRIGRSPQAYPALAEGEYADIPVNTTILGAAKFSGKTKNGWSLGILESVTNREFAEIDNNGSRRETIIEPLTNYLVGRAQKDFNDRNSYVGGIFTATNRRLDDPALEFLHEAAYTGGFDLKHSWNNRKYFVAASAVASHVTGSQQAITLTQRRLTHLFQRVDAGHVEVDESRTSLTGTGGKIEAGKSGGGNWRYSGMLIWRSPELELNDIGFLRQADEVKQFANVSYQTLQPVGIFRNYNARFEQLTSFDFEGNHNITRYFFNIRGNYRNNFFNGVQLFYRPRIFSNTLLQGGPRFRTSTEYAGSVNMGTDSRKKLRVSGGFFTSQADDRSYSIVDFDASIAYQPVNAFTISVNPNYNRNSNRIQYVTQRNSGEHSRYIMANLDQRTLSASIRLDYNINPDLTIQYYGQPFISNGKYNEFRRVTNPVAAHYRDRTAAFTSQQLSQDAASGGFTVDEDLDGTAEYSFGDPNFSFVQFRSNLVLRWEYIPGSEIFLVWSQGINGAGQINEGLFYNLDSEILGRKPENIFLVKLTYRFVL